MLRRYISLLVLLFGLAWSGSIAQADQAPPTLESSLKDAPGDSKAQLKAGTASHTALKSLFTAGHLSKFHLAKIVKNPFLSSRIGAIVSDLSTVQKIAGASRLLKNLVKSNNENRAVGFSFEAHVAARLGSQVVELSADVNGHEVDAVLRDGTLVEMKSLHVDKAIKKAMIEKATAQLALRGQQGQKLMLISNEVLSASLLKIVKAGLGTRVSVIDVGQLKAKPKAKPRFLKVSSRNVRRIRLAKRTRTIRLRKAPKLRVKPVAKARAR